MSAKSPEALERKRETRVLDMQAFRQTEYGRQYAAQYRATNKKRFQERYRQSVYGLTPEAFNAMLAEQDGKCAICRRKFEKTPQVDHCHATNRVRGLLCGRCNVGLARVQDSPELLRRMASYLEVV